MLLAVPARAQLVGDVIDAAVAITSPTVEQVGKRAAVTFASGEVTGPFDGVALQAYAEDDALTAEIRFEEAGVWGAWQPLYVVRSATDGGVLAAYRGDVVREQQRFEVRFSVAAGVPVALLGTGIFDTRRDRDGRGEAAPPGSPGSLPLHDHIDAPAMIPRATWGAEPFRGDPIPLARPNYNYMTFHHAAGFGAETREEGMRQVKAIQDFHQNGRGWSDIGYQFVVDQQGRLYQGRPFLNGAARLADVPVLAQGAHVGGNNTGNIGVSMLGCYHPPEGSFCDDVMSAAMRDSVVATFAFLSEAYDVEPALLRGHRDFSATACPGDNNYALLPSFRQEIDQLLESGTEPLPETFVLAESFPNPFRDATTIRYFLEQEGVVTLEVYDVMGRRVARLDEGFREPGRWYEAPFEPSTLADGTYFYRIMIEGFSDIIFDETRAITRVR